MQAEPSARTSWSPDGRDFAVVTATVRGPDGRRGARTRTSSSRSPTRAATSPTSASSWGATVPAPAPPCARTRRAWPRSSTRPPPRTDATANQSVLVLARLVGTDFNGATYNSVRIELRSAEPRLFPANPTNAAAESATSSWSPRPGPFFTNQVIGFHSTSVDTDGVIIRYEWNFGDGTSGRLAGHGQGVPDARLLHRDPHRRSTTTADGRAASPRLPASW